MEVQESELKWRLEGRRQGKGVEGGKRTVRKRLALRWMRVYMEYRA